MTHVIDRDRYLETSPYEADGGQKVGVTLARISVADLRALGHPETPLTAIRAKCLDCSGGNLAEVRKCVAIDCVLWPMRDGRNPFHSLARQPLHGRGRQQEVSDGA